MPMNAKKQWQRKLEGKEDLIDWNKWKAIQKIPILAVAIKCYYSINHYSQRDYKINYGTAMNKCLRCSQKEI